jgi:hypothetical protein
VKVAILTSTAGALAVAVAVLGTTIHILCRTKHFYISICIDSTEHDAMLYVSNKLISSEMFCEVRKFGSPFVGEGVVIWNTFYFI